MRPPVPNRPTLHQPTNRSIDQNHVANAPSLFFSRSVGRAVTLSRYCSRASCGRLATLRCGVCNLAHYCSVQCRVRDWPRHKQFCKSMPRPEPTNCTSTRPSGRSPSSPTGAASCVDRLQCSPPAAASQLTVPSPTNRPADSFRAPKSLDGRSGPEPGR